MRGPSFLLPDQPVRLWTSLLLPPLAWFSYEIGLSAVVRTICHKGGPPVGPVTGAAALALCGLAVWLAAPRAVGATDNADEKPRRFLARLSIGFAALFGLAIAYQLLATLMVPPCAR